MPASTTQDPELSPTAGKTRDMSNLKYLEVRLILRQYPEPLSEMPAEAEGKPFFHHHLINIKALMPSGMVYKSNRVTGQGLQSSGTYAYETDKVM